jgi:predicted nuclease with TOPRIM domain
VDRVKTSEAKLNAQVEAHKAEVEDLKKKLAKMNENFEVAKAKHEISEMERSRVEKNVVELRDSKERCYETSLECAKKLKIVLQRWEHTLRSRSLSAVIPKGLSSGSARKPKLSMKYSATVGISVLLPTHEGSWQF